jgi:hypothetical protein
MNAFVPAIFVTLALASEATPLYRDQTGVFAGTGLANPASGTDGIMSGVLGNMQRMMNFVTGGGTSNAAGQGVVSSAMAGGSQNDALQNMQYAMRLANGHEVRNVEHFNNDQGLGTDVVYRKVVDGPDGGKTWIMVSESKQNLGNGVENGTDAIYVNGDKNWNQGFRLRLGIGIWIQDQSRE